MCSLVKAIRLSSLTISALLILVVSVSLEQKGGKKLIQTGIVVTDFNYNQHYGGIHCGTKRRTIKKGALRADATGEPGGPEEAQLVDSLKHGPDEGSNSTEAQVPVFEEPDEESTSVEAQTRVFNGRKQYNNTDFNFVALIRIRIGPVQHHFCSGVLITDRHILTAAHCLQKCRQNSVLSAYTSGVTVSLGEVFERWDADLKTRIKSIHVHEHYHPCKPNYEYDIAMLTTAEAIPVTEATNRVCLPPYVLNAYGGAYALGFGFTSKTDRLPWRRLNAYEVMMNNDDNCINRQPPYKADMVCVGGLNLNFCPGDSGGPLVVDIQGAWTLVGINSITDSTTTDAVDCSGTNRRSKFVRVNKLIRWLGETIEKT